MPPIRKKHVFAEDTAKEDRLQIAKAEWEQGLWPSQRAAANAHNVTVPGQTLSDRINGRLTRRQAHESQQYLSNEEEAMIINWIASTHVPSNCPVSLPHSRMLPSDGPSVINSVSRTRVGHVSDYFTHSQPSQKASVDSSVAASISIALDPPLPKSYEEMRTKCCRLQMQLGLLEREVAKVKAETKASNAHCTIMTHAASASKTELENQKRKTRRSVKTNAHLISHPMLVENHEADQQLKALWARKVAEARAQTAAEEALREARIQEEIRTRTFTKPLSSYKRKDDLVALSGALGLKTSGTINKLTAQLRAHMATHPEIQHNSRFSGLFLTRRRRMENVV